VYLQGFRIIMDTAGQPRFILGFSQPPEALAPGIGAEGLRDLLCALLPVPDILDIGYRLYTYIGYSARYRI